MAFSLLHIISNIVLYNHLMCVVKDDSRTLFCIISWCVSIVKVDSRTLFYIIIWCVSWRLIQEEKDSAEQRAEELESQVGGVSMGGVSVDGPGASSQEGLVSRWHAHQSSFGQLSPPGSDLPSVPSPAMHPRSNISQQKYLVVSKQLPRQCVLL